MTKPQKAILGWSATITGLICFGIMGYTIYDSLPPPLPPQAPQQFENSQPPPPLPKQTRTPRRERRTRDFTIPDHVRALLGDGDGHDYLALSTEEKLQLCNLIAETTKQKTGWYYFNFLNAFYSHGQDHQPSITMQISEAAAVAAVWKDE